MMFNIVNVTAAALAIPILNLLLGCIVGLNMLILMIQNGNVARVLQGLFFALIWCLIAAAVLFSFTTVVLWPIALVGHFLYNRWLLNWFNLVSAEKITEQLKKLREEFQNKAVFNDIFGASPLLSFDVEKKLFAFVYENIYFVKPFDYVKTWKLEWTEVNGACKHVKLVLTTTDIDRPIIRIPFDSKADGDALSARLSILLG